jgi:hypothetical protein
MSSAMHINMLGNADFIFRPLFFITLKNVSRFPLWVSPERSRTSTAR